MRVTLLTAIAGEGCLVTLNAPGAAGVGVWRSRCLLPAGSVEHVELTVNPELRWTRRADGYYGWTEAGGADAPRMTLRGEAVQVTEADVVILELDGGGFVMTECEGRIPDDLVGSRVVVAAASVEVYSENT